MRADAAACERSCAPVVAIAWCYSSGAVASRQRSVRQRGDDASEEDSGFVHLVSKSAWFEVNWSS